MQKSDLPIGIFDSGLGGLTVVKEIVKNLPRENIIYLGDTARVPYGTRSKETVKKFSLEDANFLLRKKVKCIVIACNTSSALAGNYLKQKLNIPVFDVISPARKEALKISAKEKIGVIGTRGTVESGAYGVLHSQACPLFVPFIEEGELNSPALKIIIKKYLSSLKGNVETLILGCTHYPIIQKQIAEIMGKKVNLIDPGKCVAEEVKNFLVENNMQNVQKSKGGVEYYVTDMTERFTKVAETFLGSKIGSKLKEVNL